MQKIIPLSLLNTESRCKNVKRTAVKLANGDYSIRNRSGQELYRLQRRYHSNRASSRCGYDKIARISSGEYVQMPYFCHFNTLKQALRSCGC